jgi:SAM-dependent methyltransferase
MSDFTAEWLALREPADHRARSARLARDTGERLMGRPPLHVVDLGSGTGSNLRYLTRRLPPVQHWRLVDRDRALLGRIRKATMWAVVASVHLQPRDLADLAANADLFKAASLVTASALLDLVSAAWIDALAERCESSRAAALFALTYDGRIACTPADRDDEFVRGLVNSHQRTDKGFGPALGPDAVGATQQAFASRGFAVERDRSDWILEGRDAELQRQLIDGWAAAASELRPAAAATIGGWRQRRLEHVAAARSTIVVGHEDLAAWLRSRG